MKTLIIILLYTFLGSTANAQNKNDLSLGKVKEFTTDSAFSFRNWYTVHHIIYPIKGSKSDWEIRMFRYDERTVAYLKSGSLFLIKGIADSVYFERTDYYTDDTFYINKGTGNYKLADSSNGYNDWPVYRQILQFQPLINGDSVINELIENCLLTIQDCDIMMQTQNGVIKVDEKAGGGSYMAFEVKYRNMYRNFRINFAYTNANMHLELFKKATTLVNIIKGLFFSNVKIIRYEEKFKGQN